MCDCNFQRKALFFSHDLTFGHQDAILKRAMERRSSYTDESDEGTCGRGLPVLQRSSTSQSLDSQPTLSMADDVSISSVLIEENSESSTVSSSSTETHTKRANMSWIFKQNLAKYEFVGEQYAFHCKVDKCKHVNRHKSYSTGPIGNHIKRVHKLFPPGEKVKQSVEGPFDKFVTKSTHTSLTTTTSFRDKLLDFVVSSQSPFTIVENEDLEELIRAAQAAPSPAIVRLPSADTVKNTMVERYAQMHQGIAAILQQQKKNSHSRSMSGPRNGVLTSWE